MGEGMLVGSFARALFLVHSECAESRYIASRPFRVNAGPVSFSFKAFLTDFTNQVIALGWADSSMEL